MILDLPEFIHCEVNLEFVSNKKGFEECYIFAVTCIPSRTPLFTIHTINGAVFSRLPLWAFKHLDSTNKHTLGSELVPWGCVGSKAVAVKHSYLKDYEVQTSLGAGRYLMTIDYFDGNFSEDPEQHKTHNIIELYSGHYCAMPNNYCTFVDKYFINQLPQTNHYKRQSVYHLAD